MFIWFYKYLYRKKTQHTTYNIHAHIHKNNTLIMHCTIHIYVVKWYFISKFVQIYYAKPYCLPCRKYKKQSNSFIPWHHNALSYWLFQASYSFLNNFNCTYTSLKKSRNTKNLPNISQLWCLHCCCFWFTLKTIFTYINHLIVVEHYNSFCSILICHIQFATGQSTT